MATPDYTHPAQSLPNKALIDQSSMHSDHSLPRKRSRMGMVVRAVVSAALLGYLIAAWILSPSHIAPVAFAIIFIILKLGLHYVANSRLIAPVNTVFGIAHRPYARLPGRVRVAILAITTLLIAIIAIFVIGDTLNGSRLDRFRSLCGLIFIIGLMYATSAHRRNIAWGTVASGILLQFLLGLFVIKSKAGSDFFKYLAEGVSDFLGFARVYGCTFIFGDVCSSKTIFAVSVLPSILFFASFIQIVYYFGGMQWLVVKFAWIMMRLMGTSGSESVVAAASPFVGQGESALLVKPFLEFMTLSELHQTMTSGFSTIAGSVLVAFLNMNIDSVSLITSCIMSIPCSLALSKLRIPETEESLSKGSVTIPENKEREVNALHAAANGAAQGLTLVGLIVASLLCIYSLYAIINMMSAFLFGLLLINMDITRLLGYIFSTFAFAIGVPLVDCIRVGQLLGMKMVTNEFLAFINLKVMIQGNMIQLRSQYLATYALCGFANVISVGIQVGCLGAMAPTRRNDLARLAFSAMLTGTMCTFCSACIAGILL